jgi:tetratricopeptide (TPR) repeat protein
MMPSSRNRTLVWLLATLPFLPVASTRGQEAPPAPPLAPAEEITLLKVPPPALEGLEEAVRTRLAEGARRLAEVREEVETAELAGRFGELGHLYHAYALWPSAAVAYENARRLQPEEPLWTYGLAVVAFQQGEVAAAKPLFEAVIAAQPDLVAPWLYLAEIALQQGNAAEARQRADHVVQLNRSPAGLSALGRALMVEGRHAEAAAAFRGALEQVPEANRLHYLLGMALRAQGDFQTAADQLALAGPVGVKLPEPLEPVLAAHRGGQRIPRLEGDLALRAGRARDAVAAYQRALAAKPNDAEVHARLAVAQAADGDGAGAERSLRRAIELEPAATSALLNLGLLLAQTGRPAEALGHLRELLAIDPRNVTANREVGAILAAQGEREAALQHLLPVVGVEPADEESRFRTAVLLVDLGRFAEARDLLRQGLEIDPQAVRLGRALARILAAAPTLAARDGAQAIELAEKLYLASSQPGDLELLALAQAESGRCADAAVSYRLLGADAPDEALRRRFAERAAAAAAAAEAGSACRP